MEAEFWHERWGSGRTAWDQPAVHPVLSEHWTHLTSAGVGAVFVPLCGKTVDMQWLAAQGHRVVGVELSPIGVRQFFADRQLEASVTTEGPFELHRVGPYELWCGDFFDVTPAMLEGVGAVYDRASLVALPPDMRRRYVDHLDRIVPDTAIVFLLSFEYDPDEMVGPPFSVTADEISDLYGDRFAVHEVVRADVLDRNADLGGRGLSQLTETLTILRRPT